MVGALQANGVTPTLIAVDKAATDMIQHVIVLLIVALTMMSIHVSIGADRETAFGADAALCVPAITACCLHRKNGLFHEFMISYRQCFYLP